jgi:hypothetical protein
MDPLEKFDNDLKIFLEECLNEGELIILGIDINEDVRSSSFSQLLATMGLRDIRTNKHGVNGPPTYARGSSPINALYVSAALCDLKCGYLPVVSDHRVLWMDVPYAVAFGRKFPNLPIHKPQRLILQDPRVVSKYVDSLQKFLNGQGILEKATALRKAMESEGCNAELIKWYNEIDNIRLKGILIANKKCRHIKMGQVPLSPTLIIAWNRIKVSLHTNLSRVDLLYLLIWDSIILIKSLVLKIPSHTISTSFPKHVKLISFTVSIEIYLWTYEDEIFPTLQNSYHRLLNNQNSSLIVV